ncbi:MAG: succinyl-diaminopimelate desuccinylase [PS1 clade bacterium]|uniref:Succinyl-diaminopimelate desuccinylase n=1 Tax=PS1 clade bacterium TaxID=2175152 RepID=A0A368DWP2_9PROT|nr:MAG: succinyl-diaminopimelate desuccinylase [PS1 clade bacterium]HCV49374.1 succinyl-diaminopimelate desuccinylase [Rhodobiaceae bacterium]|tara:strand:+ start:5604 stop:6782 length:1179 start_codon:yes stop_codon:yes gene_type:complete
MQIDPVNFAAELIRCPSVTPADAGALDLLEKVLTDIGFTCTRLPFQEPDTARVDNLYARIGDTAPHICFAGHTDVVPVGATDSWQKDPFSGEISDDKLWGRGAADMKGAIAAFVAATADYLAQEGKPKGSISLLITGDEEGPSVNGTIKMLDWLSTQQEVIDDCIVGEPTNPETLGEMIKIGRRGSVNTTITVEGIQGHVAYPHRAANPVPHLVQLLERLIAAKLDDGTPHFQPSNLELTGFDVGNAVTNVIPALAQARFNIRYNDIWNRESITDWINENLNTAHDALNDAVDGENKFSLSVDINHSGEAFLTPTGALSELAVSAVEKTLGMTPELSTSGGTSDARFIKDHSRVIEFGLVGKTMHKVDEHVRVDDIRSLTNIYQEILSGYFS